MSNSYYTHDTQLFPRTNVLTGIVLQHKGQNISSTLPHFITMNRNMQNMKL